MKSYIKKGIGIALSALMLSGCAPAIDDVVASATPTAIVSPSPSQEVIMKGSFASQMSAALIGDGSKNAAFSPISAQMAMAMAYAAAQGETALELEQALGWAGQSPEQLMEKLAAQIKELEQMPGHTLSIANMALLREDLQTEDTYTQLVTKLGAIVEKMDFGQQTAVMDRVNGWVKEQTRGKIDSILEEVSPANVAFLVNATYLKAAWQIPFKEEATFDAPFYTPDGEITVDMMQLYRSLSLYEDENAYALRLPMEQEGESFIAVLPKEGREEAFLAALAEGALDEYIAMQGAQEKMIALKLPRFEAKIKTSLVDSMKALGIERAFDGGRAQMGGLAKDEQLALSDVLQRVAITVDEGGLEAAAATAVIVSRTSLPIDEPFEIVFDRPFLYAIDSGLEDGVLFTGWVASPVGE